MRHRFTYPRLPVLALIAVAAACESPTELPLHVGSLTLEAVGDVAQLTATGAEGELPMWESLDTTVVTVTPAGMAVAVREGTATVRARLGSRSAEAAVTVLPPVDVQVSNLQVVTDPEGHTGLSMQVTNVGGRGYYRIQHWRDAAEGETEPQLVSSAWSDSEAGVGVSYGVTHWDLPEIPDWVVVYSREPTSLVHEMTSCVRVDGAPCPVY